MLAEAPSRKRILVVEDEAIVARDIAQSLTGLGYEVSGTAASAVEALRLAAATGPALAFMDIHIQGPVDGVETATQLSERFDIPVIFLTAYSDTDTISRATRARPYGYLVKPPGERELQTAVEVALERHAGDQTARLMARVIGSAGIGVVVARADEAQPIVHVNPAFERLSEYTGDGLVGQSVWRLDAPDSGPSSAMAELRTAAREQRRARVWWRCAGPDGKIFTTEVSVCPVRHPAGDVTHLLLCFDDRTSAS